MVIKIWFTTLIMMLVTSLLIQDCFRHVLGKNIKILFVVNLVASILSVMILMKFVWIHSVM